MRDWLRGKRGGLIAFLAIATLVAGGLGWVTSAALRLEAERIEARAQAEAEAERNDKLRLAMWSLDSWMYHVLSREESRPYNHYSAVYAVRLALQNDGNFYPPGSVLEPSPLLNTELPAWMLIHFQVDKDAGWGSPQVLTKTLRERLENANARLAFGNVTVQREQVLTDISKQLPALKFLAHPQLAGVQPTARDHIMVWAMQRLENQDVNVPANQASNPVYQSQPGQQNAFPQEQQRNMRDAGNRADLPNKTGANYRSRQNDNPYKEEVDDLRLAFGNTCHNGEGWFLRGEMRRWCSQQSTITLSPMRSLWLKGEDDQELLIVARMVRIDEKQICQGILLDWSALQKELTREVTDLFPEASIQPMREAIPPHPERTMTALPLELDPGPITGEPPQPGWTPLRIGLALAWAAALVALAAVGLGGWSLIDLSERRIRFVSAVTHELRTPLTTLRLYLDMLTGGMVKDDAQKSEYLQTLNSETDRLHRLVGNVLDFSRLENQKPQLEVGPILVGDLLEQVRSTWQGRCHDAGKELIVENILGEEAVIFTDDRLVQQILSNLIDNACKYTRTAEDCRLWLRSRQEDCRLILEVEDRGPGVAPRERRSIFRPFRRGGDADVKAGGVGLGLALAQRWSAFLGGKLTVGCGCENVGACFRLELPLQSNG